MCGFAVILSAYGDAPNCELTISMAHLMAHRGPDDASQFGEHGISLAFRRLAIFDPSDSSRQPMVSQDGRYVIAFNGAIYNFIELRSELKSLGYAFQTNGDTEVLLAAYQQWGSDCLHRLNGMWAFVIYDRRNRTIFAARDRFGVKPLFWQHDTRGLAITSEIKALRDSGYAASKPNWQTIATYFLEGQLDINDDTFYEGIQRVPAGSFFESDGRATPKFTYYWNLKEAAASLDEPTNAVEEFRELFDDAVRLRMRADVPMGVLLSGGLDSTSILCSMAAHSNRGSSSCRALEALCYLDPGYDEMSYIDATVEQTGATLHRLYPEPESCGTPSTSICGTRTSLFILYVSRDLSAYATCERAWTESHFERARCR